MRHAEIRKKLVQRLAWVLTQALPLKLHGFQKEGLKKLVTWLKKRKASQHRAFYSWATGLGKTVQFSTIAKACAGGHLRVLVIVPTKVLVSQTIRKLSKWVNGSMGHISSNPKILDHDGEIISLRSHKDHGVYELIVCTDESFKKQYARIKRELDPHLIVWDECHWGYSELAQKALSVFSEALILAFSATTDYLTTTCKPEYIPVTLDNGTVLYAPPDRMARAHFGDCIDERTVRWGIQNGYLAPFAWGRVEFKVSLKGVKTVVGPEGVPDYDQASLHKVLKKNWKSMVGVVRKLYKSGQYDLRNRATVAICPGVQEAETLAKEMRKIGVSAACISGATSDEERDQLLAAFDRGEIKLLTSIFVLREGWDTDKAEVCLMLRPTKSRVLYVQFMGRVLRIDLSNPDKVALVLDPYFQDVDFAPLSAPILFGLPGQKVYDGDIIIPPRKRRGRKLVNPYLVDSLDPVLVVERPEIEYWANEEGVAVIDGIECMTADAYGRRIGSSGTIVQQRINQHRLKSKQGRDVGGHDRLFYPIIGLDRACVDLRKPKADASGILVIDGVEYTMVGSYASRIGTITYKTVQVLVEEHGLQPTKGRDAQGRGHSFFRTKDLDHICAGFRNGQKAGPEGVIVIKGIEHILVTAYASRHGVTPETIKIRIEETNLRSEKGLDMGNNDRDFYSLTDLDRSCKDLLVRADAKGILRIDGIKCIMVEAYARLRDIVAPSSVRKRIKKYGLARLEGRNVKGHESNFYSLADLDRVCADLIAKKRAKRRK